MTVMDDLLKSAVEWCDARSDVLSHSGPTDARVDLVFNMKLDRLAQAEVGVFKATSACMRLEKTDG